MYLMQALHLVAYHLPLLQVLHIFRQLQLQPLALLSAHEFHLLCTVETHVFRLYEPSERGIPVIVVLFELEAVHELVKSAKVDQHDAEHDQVEEGQLEQEEGQVGVQDQTHG